MPYDYIVLVPKPGSMAEKIIDRGSGIVTRPLPEGRFPKEDGAQRMVYFEGNRYGAENLRTFKERVIQAAGRLHTRYPTVARGLFPASEFEEVGTLVVAADGSYDSLVIDSPFEVERWVCDE
jgi:hypothetical protein